MKRSVCCSVTENAVRREVHQAGAACGAMVLDVDLPLRRRARRRPACDGLVYDLAPWNDSALDALLRVRGDFPTLPIFLVVPSSEAGTALLRRCVGIPCTHGIVHTTGAATRVQEGVQTVLASGPATVMGQLLQALFPALPERIVNYATGVIDSLEGERDAVRVGELLRLLAFTPRVAERAFAQAALPTPKRMADWLTLMLIAMGAERGQLTLVDAARAFGYDSNEFYRLRQRLWPTGPSGLDIQATQAFDLTLLAFADACGVSRERALSALARGERVSKRA